MNNTDSSLSDFEREIEELIVRRRRQILVHSCIYYRFNTSIIDDRTFDAWAYQLASLQDTYPDIADNCDWAEPFKGFDGTTGFHLPTWDSRIVNKAKRLIDLDKKYRKEDTVKQLIFSDAN